MSISLPTYTRREAPLLGRPYRILAIITAGLRREFRRPAAIFAIAVGTLVTTATSVITLYFAPFILQGQPLDFSFFYIPASNGTILFFVSLMAAIVGGGLVADDIHSMAISLYFSRPITRTDYLVAKAAILAPLVAMVSILPLVATALAAPLLGLFPWDIALRALGTSVAVGLLLVGFYTAVTLLLSSVTARRGYAAAGVFVVTFGLTLPAGGLSNALGNASILYISPWDDYLGVARAAFGVPRNPIDWGPALAILLGFTVLAALITYWRLRMAEVVAT